MKKLVKIILPIIAVTLLGGCVGREERYRRNIANERERYYADDPLTKNEQNPVLEYDEDSEEETEDLPPSHMRTVMENMPADGQEDFFDYLKEPQDETEQLTPSEIQSLMMPRDGQEDFFDYLKEPQE